MDVAEKAAELRRLHADPELLVVVNVWDVVSATVVAAQEGTRAIATASHSIASTFGYPDGEQIPLDLMLDMCGRIAAAVDLPVTADLEAGYGNAGETIRRAIAQGIVGANLEDQMKPLPEAVAAVEAVVKAGEQEGVPFALNARTDALIRAGSRDRAEALRDAAERGRAFLDAGATCVFVPGPVDRAALEQLVKALGPQKLSVIGYPGIPLSHAELTELGVARISYGPFTQRVALGALQHVTQRLMGGGALPDKVSPLN